MIQVELLFDQWVNGGKTQFRRENEYGNSEVKQMIQVELVFDKWVNGGKT